MIAIQMQYPDLNITLTLMKLNRSAKDTNQKNQSTYRLIVIQTQLLQESTRLERLNCSVKIKIKPKSQLKLHGVLNNLQKKEKVCTQLSTGRVTFLLANRQYHLKYLNLLLKDLDSLVNIKQDMNHQLLSLCQSQRFPNLQLKK